MPIGPVFKRVLQCFDSKAEFARQVQVDDRQVVNYWCQIGYIPARHAVRVSIATGGKVPVLEILNEAERLETRRMVERQLRSKRRAGAAPGGEEQAG